MSLLLELLPASSAQQEGFHETQPLPVSSAGFTLSSQQGGLPLLTRKHRTAIRTVLFQSRFGPFVLHSFRNPAARPRFLMPRFPSSSQKELFPLQNTAKENMIALLEIGIKAEFVLKVADPF